MRDGYRTADLLRGYDRAFEDAGKLMMVILVAASLVAGTVGAVVMT